ncbi:RRP15-like protein [Solanum pennellii]|uniref:RRP15-like protein n=1 Tax=Solanum pennellii TaxID=28526 RepID=A0ABM1GQK2_SOLPN|nr:RRP15-like protein [Solanum pennellii]
MAEESVSEATKYFRKRKMEHRKKGGKGKKKQKGAPFSEKRVKIDNKMKKLFEKRARDYNSDNEDDNDGEPSPVTRAKRTAYGKDKPKSYGKEKPTSYGRDKSTSYRKEEEDFDEEWADDGEEDLNEEIEISEDEDGEVQPGITKFIDGCNAFRLAFKKIQKKSASDDILGPVLSAHKKLVAEKLAEEDVERKVKGEAKKEKHLIREKGHEKPANFLDTYEKSLIAVATKGVVKLFNAVNKAQHAQKGLNPSRAKDEKVIKKRRREVFFSELGKAPSQTTVSKAGACNFLEDEGPAWAPLRDNYMLTNPKLKDWDKNPDTTVDDDVRMPADSDSSDDE